MKILITFLSAIISFILFSLLCPIDNNSSTMANNLSNPQVLCSSFSKIAKCTGSAYCRACKNCKYCKHCNSGGSCGVCGKEPMRIYPSKSKKREKSPTAKTKQESTKTKTNINQDENNTFFSVSNNLYMVKKKTSLRSTGNAKARIIKRLYLNTIVQVIDTSDQYWWKVIYKDKIGWVKKHLLVLVKHP